MEDTAGLISTSQDHDRQSCSSPVFPNFSQPLTQTWQVVQGRRAAVTPFTALVIHVNREGQRNWRPLQRQRDRVSVVTDSHGEQPQNLCALSGEVSILGLLGFC